MKKDFLYIKTKYPSSVPTYKCILHLHCVHRTQRDAPKEINVKKGSPFNLISLHHFRQDNRVRIFAT